MIEMIEAGFRSPCLYTHFLYHGVYFKHSVLISSFSCYFILYNSLISSVRYFSLKLWCIGFIPTDPDTCIFIRLQIEAHLLECHCVMN